MNRTAEIAAAREADEKIAAAWSVYYVAAEKITIANRTLKDLKQMMYRINNGAERVAAQEAVVKELQEAARPLREAAIALNAELYKGWKRFFLVKHIHGSMECSSFRATTRIAWLPGLSGQTEAEAVAEHGAILCTICFPTAPTEWTEGKKEDDNVCSGSGKFVGTQGRRYQNCPDCGQMNAVTSIGNIRKHKTA